MKIMRERTTVRRATRAQKGVVASAIKPMFAGFVVVCLFSLAVLYPRQANAQTQHGSPNGIPLSELPNIGPKRLGLISTYRFAGPFYATNLEFTIGIDSQQLRRLHSADHRRHALQFTFSQWDKSGKTLMTEVQDVEVNPKEMRSMPGSSWVDARWAMVLTKRITALSETTEIGILVCDVGGDVCGSWSFRL
jgi:hypothetical protein